MFNIFKKFFSNPEESKDVSQIHEVTKTMVEMYNVPGHFPRTDSSLYTKNHHDIVVVQDSPCYICGVKNSTLKDPQQNLIGATQIETHHFKVEWGLANAVDWTEMKALYPDFPDWLKIDPNDETTYFNFVDSVYNLIPLCDKHHRGINLGIHAIEYSVWQAQKYAKKDFPLIVKNQGKSFNGFVDDLS